MLFLQERFIDEHHLRHTFQRQCILFSPVGTGLQCRRVKIARFHLPVSLDESIQRTQCTRAAELHKIFRQDDHHIRLLSQQILPAEPFGVLLDPDAAGVLDLHVRVLFLKPGNGGINKGVVVLTRDIPIAVAREADAQHYFAVGCDQNDDHCQQKGQHRFPIPAHTPVSGWLFWFCTAQMASWVRSRSSSLRRMLLM